MRRKCESCDKWEKASFNSFFIRCPQCGRSRDREATRARDAKVAQSEREETEAYKHSEGYLKVIHAVLDVYDDYVLEHGANTKHVYFILTYKAVAARLNTTPHYVKKALAVYGGPMEQILVEHGRGYFQFVGSGYGPFRYFRGYQPSEYVSKNCA